MQAVSNITGRITDYLSYFLKTRFKFNIHSPFVYDFVDSVLEDYTEYPEYQKIENIRSKYRESKEKLQKHDFGAGAKKQRPKIKNTTVGKIIRNSSIEPKEGKLLYRMVNYYKPKYILEVGTSLGISTMYQALGAKEHGFQQFETIEGCPNVSAKAQQLKQELQEEEPILEGIRYNVGPFEEQLPAVLEKMPQVDFVFFDGNHNREAILNYFHWCLPKAHEKSIFVFDDIYHSRKMKKAWKTVQINQKVRTTVNLFTLGIVFFNNPYAKQNFMVRF